MENVRSHRRQRHWSPASVSPISVPSQAQLKCEIQLLSWFPSNVPQMLGNCSRLYSKFGNHRAMEEEFAFWSANDFKFNISYPFSKNVHPPPISGVFPQILLAHVVSPLTLPCHPGCFLSSSSHLPSHPQSRTALRTPNSSPSVMQISLALFCLDSQVCRSKTYKNTQKHKMYCC